MRKEDFLIYYSGLSTVELLKIIEQKENYQPDAIEAANKILSERNYSHDELIAAQAETNLVVNKKIERQEKINKKINSVNAFIDEHFGIKERTAEKKLNFFCAGIFLYIFFQRHLQDPGSCRLLLLNFHELVHCNIDLPGPVIYYLFAICQK